MIDDGGDLISIQRDLEELEHESQRGPRIVANEVARNHRAQCRSGHAFTPENIYLSPAGVRQCVRCNRNRSATYSAARRAAREAGRDELISAAMREKEWRGLVHFPGYFVSVDGEVGSAKKSTWRILNPTGTPYLRVGLAVGLNVVSASVHVLVTSAFHGPRPEGLVVRHRNGNRTDNRPCNLTWGTQSENIADSVGHGTHRQTRKTECPAGHPYAGSNLKVTPSGSRICRTCKRAREDQSRKATRRATGLEESWTRHL